VAFATFCGNINSNGKNSALEVGRSMLVRLVWLKNKGEYSITKARKEKNTKNK
jgi:hypothetical protein